MQVKNLAELTVYDVGMEVKNGYGWWGDLEEHAM